MTHEYLEERGGSGDRRKFDRALAKVRDVEPAPRDRLWSTVTKSVTNRRRSGVRATLGG